MALPPTVNMHIVGHCNYKCLYCYARFEKAKTFLPLDAARVILRDLKDHGARRITFAGGEPTLHPDLVPMLRCCAELGLVTSVVTNASQLDRDMCRRLFPWLRWLVLSCDSHVRATNDALGRKSRLVTLGQPARVEDVVAWLHEWNKHRPAADAVQCKLNIVVTSLNAHEDPSAWLAQLRPERVKLLQCCIIPGENEDAAHLRCEDAAFASYAERVIRGTEGVKVVAESSEDLLDSYAMIDPLGRFRQARAAGYVESDPIQAVGVRAAWDQVGGCDMERFRARGGEYDAGQPCRMPGPSIIAIEGLDGTGKSTTVAALARRLGAKVVTSVPARLASERPAADALPPAERRAWYRRANIEAMREATDHVFTGHTVVMDRCFASTTAYGAAERGRVATPDDVPKSTPRPDVIILLSVPEEERQRRIRQRAVRLQPEEQRLARDADFRRQVLEGYLALGALPVEASGPDTVIVEAIAVRLEHRVEQPRRV